MILHRLRKFSVSAIAALTLLAMAGPVHAARSGLDATSSPDWTGSYDHFSGMTLPDMRPKTGDGLIQLAFGDDTTNAIIRQLQRGAGECSRLEATYRIDCLQQVYSQAAGATNNRPDYAGANSALRGLSRKLSGIVRQNQDKQADKAKIRGKTYRAVARQALREANRQANQAIEEAATKLLRSAGNSQKRKVHYTRIADAVNSTKKLLRS